MLLPLQIKKILAQCDKGSTSLVGLTTCPYSNYSYKKNVSVAIMTVGTKR